MFNVVILAGGLGTKLKPNTKDIPKSLVKIGPKTVIEHQIDMLKASGFENITVSLGYKSLQIKEYLGTSVDYIVEDKPLGTGGAIKYASKKLAGELVVLSGDVFSDIDFDAAYKEHKNKKNDITIVLMYGQVEKPFHGSEIKGTRVIKYDPFPSETKNGYHTTGCYILSAKVLGKEKRRSFSIERDLFTKATKKFKFGYYLHHGFLFDIGTLQRLQIARSYFEESRRL